jgi:hypothetical protein
VAKNRRKATRYARTGLALGLADECSAASVRPRPFNSPRPRTLDGDRSYHEAEGPRKDRSQASTAGARRLPARCWAAVLLVHEGPRELLQEARELLLGRCACRYADHRVVEGTILILDVPAIESEKYERSVERRALVSVDERLVFGEVERVGRPIEKSPMCRNSPSKDAAGMPTASFEGPAVPYAVKSAKQTKLHVVELLDVLDGQELGRRGHLASLRNVRSCLRTTFAWTFARRCVREDDSRTGVMIRLLPSVVSSRSVSGVIRSSSRMGLSMMIPALLPMAWRRLLMTVYNIVHNVGQSGRSSVRPTDLGCSCKA